jgi:hypothetical protein
MGKISTKYTRKEGKKERRGKGFIKGWIGIHIKFNFCLQ